MLLLKKEVSLWKRSLLFKRNFSLQKQMVFFKGPSFLAIWVFWKSSNFMGNKLKTPYFAVFFEYQDFDNLVKNYYLVYF